MTEEKYIDILKELCESDDKDIRSIGTYAKLTGHTLYFFAPCKSNSLEDVRAAVMSATGRDIIDEYMASGCDNAADALADEFDDGWYTMHGKYVAAWMDGLNVFGPLDETDY